MSELIDQRFSTREEAGSSKLEETSEYCMFDRWIGLSIEPTHSTFTQTFTSFVIGGKQESSLHAWNRRLPFTSPEAPL